MSPADGVEVAATAFVDLERPLTIDWSKALLWRVVVLHRGVPVDGFWLPSPGRLADPEGFFEPFLREAGRVAAEREVADRLITRLGVRALPGASLTTSVVVCTHRRSTYLPGLLAALARLQPAPLEVIIVDNDPGKEDSQAVIEGAGARYVREDARGLDNARNAGLRVARGDLIAYTDDDCLPPPGWLDGVSALFASPSVAAVTGPAFAAELETPSQVRFELEGGFNRGFRRVAHDWTTISPLDAARVGVGANMIFRATALRELAGGFPPELDTGTPSRSAGDLYAIYRLLRDGARAVYDPGRWVLHRHRRHPAALREALYSYGVGLSAAMTKAVVEDREPAALVTYSWLWRNFARATARRVLGSLDAEAQRCAWDYFRGSFIGAREWRRSLAIERRAGRIPPFPRRSQTPPGGPALTVGSVVDPVVTVVVSSGGEEAPLARCLAALARQTVAAEQLDVLVVDDEVAGDLRLPPWSEGWVRRVKTGGVGACAGRDAGATAARASHLLFLDDDIVPEEGCIAAHLTSAGVGYKAGVIVGRTLPRPREHSLAARMAALEAQDFADDMARAPEMRFTDVSARHVSMASGVLRACGGFGACSDAPGREGWLFGLRAMARSVPVRHATDAVGHHEYELTTREALRRARQKGAGDAALLRRHPEVATVLPPPHRPAGRVLALRHVLARPRGRSGAVVALAVLEGSRLRRLWLRGYRLVEQASYESGRGTWASPPPPRSSPPVVVRVDGSEPLHVPGPLCPPLEIKTSSGSVAVEVPLGRLTESAIRTAASASASASAAAARPAVRAHRRDRPSALPVLDSIPDEPHAASASWETVDRAVRVSSTAWVVVPLATGADLGMLSASLDVLLDGDRVAAYLGTASRDGNVAIALRSRQLHPQRHAVTGPPPDYLAVSVRHHAALSGFRPELARHGSRAPALDFVERALDAGMVVADVQLPGLARPGSRSVAERRRQQARGALAARSGPGFAAVRVLRGAVPVAQMLREPDITLPVGAAACLGYVAGVADGLRHR